MIEHYPFFLTRNNQNFRFALIENQNVITLKVNARFDSEISIEETQKIIEKEHDRKFLIQIDLGLEDGFKLDDELSLKNYILSIDHLSKNLLKPNLEKIEALIFYRGTSFLEDICVLDHLEIDSILESALSSTFENKFLNRIASATILSNILHRLIAFIPEELTALAVFEDASLMSDLEKAVLFSKERFEHLLVAFENSCYQYTSLDLNFGNSHLGFISSKDQPWTDLSEKALLLPSDAHISKFAFEKLSQMIQGLKESDIVFRLIPEKIFNECWNEIKQVAFIPKSLHPMTERMIRGFEASGGEVIEIGDIEEALNSLMKDPAILDY